MPRNTFMVSTDFLLATTFSMFRRKASACPRVGLDFQDQVADRASRVQPSSRLDLSSKRAVLVLAPLLVRRVEERHVAHGEFEFVVAILLHLALHPRGGPARRNPLRLVAENRQSTVLPISYWRISVESSSSYVRRRRGRLRHPRYNEVPAGSALSAVVPG